MTCLHALGNSLDPIRSFALRWVNSSPRTDRDETPPAPEPGGGRSDPVLGLAALAPPDGADRIADAVFSARFRDHRAGLVFVQDGDDPLFENNEDASCSGPPAGRSELQPGSGRRGDDTEDPVPGRAPRARIGFRDRASRPTIRADGCGTADGDQGDDFDRSPRQSVPFSRRGGRRAGMHGFGRNKTKQFATECSHSKPRRGKARPKRSPDEGSVVAFGGGHRTRTTRLGPQCSKDARRNETRRDVAPTLPREGEGESPPPSTRHDRLRP